MALLWIEGWDGVSASVQNASNLDTEEYMRNYYPHGDWDGSNNPQLETGRLGGKAFSGGEDGFADLNWFDVILPSDTTTVVVGFAIRPYTYIGFSEVDILQFWELEAHNPVNHGNLALQHHSSWRYDRSNVILASSFGTLSQESWSYIEFKLTVHDTTGALEMRINGETVMSETNLDTRNAGNGTLGMVRFRVPDGNNSTSDMCVMDDLYVLDTTGGAPNNDFLGPIKVEEIHPDGVGDSNQFTPSAGSNWQNVDDATANDGDTTYNESSTAAHLDLFTCEDLSTITGTGTIYGVRVDVIGRVTDTNPKTLIPKCKSSTTEGTGTSQGFADDEVFLGTTSLFEQDPNAAAAWTVTTVNAMQIGYEVG
jgi:hypothetical protein